MKKLKELMMRRDVLKAKEKNVFWFDEDEKYIKYRNQRKKIDKKIFKALREI